MMRALEPLVEKGCARILVNPAIITSDGQSTTINCFREFPRNDDMLDLAKGTNKTPGYRVDVKPTLQSECDILLTFGIQINTEDPAMLINGKVKQGVSSRSIQSTVNVKSGAPLFLGDLSTSHTASYFVVTAEILPEAQLGTTNRQ